MMGYSHVMSGMAAGLLLLPVAPVDRWQDQVAWTLMWGGAALLPDLDSPGASASRLWGPVSRVLSVGISRVSGGHRWGTHDLLLGPLAFGGLAALALVVPAAVIVVVAVALGLSLHALQVTQLWRTGPLLNFLISWVGAGWVIAYGWVSLDWWLALAVAGGTVVAIAGDWLTNEGVPIPLVWLGDRSKRWGLGAFRTGATLETVAIAPALTVATLLLTLRAVGL